jgi:hypothetical protein
MNLAKCVVMLGVLLCGGLSAATAQTGYPMLMSLKPTAAQVGTTSEHVIASRYHLNGTHQVLVSGTGVTGQIVEPEIEEGKTPKHTNMAVRFTVAGDAEPGVRDFRLATPRGVSTLGQLLIVRDPIRVEEGDNNSIEKANKASVPATLCGAIEKNEDVDYFTFSADAGQSLTFCVRSMQLQNRIHDLQQHSDPILSLKSSSGTILAQSVNHFAGDPFLCHRFEEAGDYLLEIRDVRYQGNAHWQYSVEVSERPFLAGVFPSGVVVGEETRLGLIGIQLPPVPESILSTPAGIMPGSHRFRLPLPDGLTDPVPLVVCDHSVFVEEPAENNSPQTAPLVSVPVGISGRVESASDIDCYAFEAKEGEKFSFEVTARRHQSPLDSTIRLLDAEGKRLAENDDLSLASRNHPDSQIENWSAPADGKFAVEIRDLHLRGGEEYLYFLNVTRARPYFQLYLDTDKTQLTPGSSGVIFVRAVAKNGFQGDIELQIDGLPEGVTSSCGPIRLSRGLKDACIILTAAAEANLQAANVTITGTATHKLNENEALQLSAVAVPQQETYMPGGGRNHWPVGMHTVSVGAPNDIRSIELSTHELILAPGEAKRIDVTIQRSPEYRQNVTLDMLFQHLGSVYGNSLPPGVTIDGNASKTLLTGSESNGFLTLKAAKDAKPISRQQVPVMANVSLNFVMKCTYSSRPLFVTVTETATETASK